MSDRCFLDTNIFVYAVDRDNPVKQQRAASLIREVRGNSSGVVSYQVVQEFFNLASKRFVSRMNSEDRQDYLEHVFRPMLKIHSSLKLYEDALRLHTAAKLQWYDSLIVCAASDAGCSILYSEDMQHGQNFGSLKIVNPFL